MATYGRIEGAAEDSAAQAMDIRDLDVAPARSSWRRVGLAVVGSCAVVASFVAVVQNKINAPDARLDDGSVQGAPLPTPELNPAKPNVINPTTSLNQLNYESPFTNDDDTNSFTAGLKSALARISESDSFLFGHHMTSYRGQFFKDYDSVNHNSDVYNATGKFPLVYGFDFTKVIDGDGDFKQHVTDAYGRGGVMSFMWLAPNPMNGGDSYNKSGNPCVELQPGGKANEVWTAYLDSISDFLKSIHPIPVVFRLFHEMTGWWYWWGTHSCETGDFIDAWQYTVDYLLDYKGNDNVLMFYSTSRIASDFTKYEQGNVTYAMRNNYPGDDYVDVIGFDCYDNLTFYPESLNATCADIFSFAEEKGKIPVIGETGHTGGMSCTNCGDWFREFLNVYNDPYSLCHKAAYAITWENYNTKNFYIPLVGPEPKQFEGFYNFSISGEALFQHDPLWRDISVKEGYFSNSSTDNFQGSKVGGQVGGKTTGKKDGVSSVKSSEDDSVESEEEGPTMNDDETKGKATIQNSKTHASKTNNVANTDDGANTVTVSCGKGCTESVTEPTKDDDDPLVADGRANGTYTTPADDDGEVASADTDVNSARLKNKKVRKDDPKTKKERKQEKEGTKIHMKERKEKGEDGSDDADITKIMAVSAKQGAF